MEFEHIQSDYLSEKRASETELPLIIERDRTLRAKILDSCGMTCTFCHNEGTPVAADNRDGLNFISGSGPSGRVSIFAESNGVDFVPGVMQPDDDFINAISVLRDEFSLTELHLTGGEPSLHPNLSNLIRTASDVGFSVRMTSNGENVFRIVERCAEAGLDKINLSIFGTTAKELAAVQAPKFSNIKLADRKLQNLDRSIKSAAECGVGLAANIVIPNYSHRERVFRLMDKYSNNISLRLLNSLEEGDASYEGIYRILDDLGAVPEKRMVTIASSNSRVAYSLPNEETIYFKQLREVRLPDSCQDCAIDKNGSCEEGFYGARLYVGRDGKYRVGVCIQRMDLTSPLENFIESGLVGEIHQLRNEDSQRIGAVGMYGYSKTEK
jgi:cyclic pyranopterin phosphate synthase